VAIDYVALATEINTDPTSLGYAQYLAVGDDTSIADILNAPKRNTVQSVSRSLNELLSLMISAAVQLASTDAAMQSKWDRIIKLATSANGVNPNDSTVQPIFNLAISDGLLTQTQVDAFCKQPGSRAELLFGVGVVIQHLDVAKALRG
jgi:hypothetical protein